MKIKMFFIISLFTLIMFSVNLFGCVMPDISGIKNVISLDEDENSGISLLSLSELSDIIEIKGVYRNDESCIKALVFEEKEAVDGDLKLKINDTEYPLTAEPTSYGYVFEYFDEDIAAGDVVDLSFVLGDDEYTTSASAIDIVTAEDGEWTASESGNTLLAYNGSDTDITVPNFYNGSVVINIGGNVNEEGTNYVNILNDSEEKTINSAVFSEGILNIYPYAFYGVSGLESVSFPKGLKTIYDGAFACTEITSVSFPNSLEKIGSFAFYECNSLSGDLTIPAGVKTVEYAAFYNCPNLKGALTLEEGVEETEALAFGADGSKKQGFTAVSLPGSLKKIGPYTFQYCTSITTINLPEGLETISDGAFDHMSGLNNSSVTIPSTVKTIGGDYNVDENTGYGGHVFYDMGKNETFTEFKVADGNEYFTAVDGVLYSADMTRMLAYPRGKRDSAFEIPEGITLIDEMAFSRAAYLNTVVLPDSYVITTDIPENILNNEGTNSLSIALYLYTSVNEIKVNDTNPNYKTIDGVLYSEDYKTLWYVPSKYSEEINISPLCERMEDGCIYTVYPTEITIPSSVYYIGDGTIEMLNSYFKGYMTAEESLYYYITEESKIAGLSYTLGDVNEDEAVSNRDAALVLKYILGLETNNIFNKKAADINGDGSIDLKDVIEILKL